MNFWGAHILRLYLIWSVVVEKYCDFSSRERFACLRKNECHDYNQRMHELIDEIKYSQRKTLAIEVRAGGVVIVRAPKGTGKSRIAGFVREKSEWIRQAKARMAEVPALTAQQQFHPGAQIVYLGQLWQLRHCEQVEKGLAFAEGDGFLLQKNRLDEAAELLKGFYRIQTRRLTSDYIDRHAPRWALTVSSLRITSAQTRWGSCSAKNGLNFSYRLAMLPLDVIEYVVVHELAHTRHHNHSAAFWSFVAQMLPGYQQKRDWLKRNSRQLPTL